MTKRYATRAGEVVALDGVDLHAEAGEFVCVQGHSGSGKTTLLLCLGGMLKPTAGGVTLDGDDLYARSVGERAAIRAAKVGFLFQTFHLVPYLDLIGNVRAGRRGTTRAEAVELLTRVGLGDRVTHKPARLSVGERQRAALARALAGSPRVLLCDEPTGNLDPANSEMVFAMLREFRDNGGCVVAATHEAELTRLGDKVVSLSGTTPWLSGGQALVAE